MPNLGPMELIIILLIVLFIFGAGRLPELGGAIGRGIRDFRKALNEDDEESSPKPAKPGSQDA
ncbi:MAG: twin-arginine translocase TatA/TatE family subunit [Chloroflexi bacterium]|nr:twin-arginine translocase TatA/TatE family subunit [Chloroflexota bacterium]